MFSPCFYLSVLGHLLMVVIKMVSSAKRFPEMSDNIVFWCEMYSLLETDKKNVAIFFLRLGWQLSQCEVRVTVLLIRLHWGMSIDLQ